MKIPELLAPAGSFRKKQKLLLNMEQTQYIVEHQNYH